MTEQKQFADGLIIKPLTPNTPKWVKMKLSIKVDDFKKLLDKNNTGGWVNIDVKEGKSGKIYAEVDSWKPSGDNKQELPTVEVEEEISDEAIQNIPF